MTLRLVHPDPAGPPALTEPPDHRTPSKPEPTQSDRENALVWVAEGTVSSGPLAPAIASLKAEGWTPRTALAALRASTDRTGTDHAAALRNGPAVRLVRPIAA